MRLHKRLLVGLLLFVPFGLLAAVPSIIPPKDEPAAGELAKFSIEGASGPADWQVVRADGTKPTLEVSADGKTVLFGTGRSRQPIIVRAAVPYKDGEVDKAKLLEEVLYKDAPQPMPNPDDPPKPDPTPDPQPEPVGTVKSFVVVEDTASAGQWRGNLLGSKDVQAYYLGNGLKHRIISKGQAATENPVVKDFLNRAQGKVLPYLWTFDSTGKLLSERSLGTKTDDGQVVVKTSPDEFIRLIGGRTVSVNDRKLGNLSQEKLRLSWTKFGDAPNVPLIPRSQWVPTDLSVYFPEVYDQDGRGQCNASAACTVMETIARMTGTPYKKLSAGDLYSRINGGRDQGSFLEDALAELLKNGVCTTDLVPYVWDGRVYNSAAVKESRSKHLAVEAYVCPNFDAMASALQQGFVLDLGLLWYSGYDYLDADGWLTANSGQQVGGHALAGGALVSRQKNGRTQWGILVQNSWTKAWGRNGRCVIPEEAFSSSVGGFFAVRSIKPTEGMFPPPMTPAPVLKSKLLPDPEVLPELKP